ncbi:hypothetical protein [Campylobacter devanensis]|uniref:hypothetical protein n=1 Tax=Campylobacter devanensis TaxID=3161138 RepID=UPI000A34FF17|nr:hypothetical protein [Campylobacter sp. P093]
MKTNRRKLKLGAALSLAPMLPSNLFAGANTQVVKNGEVFTSAHWGMLKATVKDGKIISSKPYQTLSKIPNPLQDTMADLVYKTRITAPMVRKSYLENPDSPKP